MKILFIGGTRFLGPKIIDAFLAAGHNVSVFNRGNNYGYAVPKAVTVYKGDRNNPDDVKQLGNQAYDYVYDMTCYDKPQVDGLLRVLQPTAHIVFLSTAAVYKKPRLYPLSETSELGAWDSFGRYGADKAEVEKAYMDFAQKHALKLTIFRPVYLLGNNNYFDRENYYFSRIHKGLPILIPGNGQALMQFAFAEETAKALAGIPFVQQSPVEILNVGGNDFISLEDFVLLCADIAGKPAHIRKIRDTLPAIEEDQFYDDLYPFPNLNFILSNTKIVNEYDVSFMSLETGLRAVYDAWMAAWDGTVKTYPKELEILKQLDKHA